MNEFEEKLQDYKDSFQNHDENTQKVIKDEGFTPPTDDETHNDFDSFQNNSLDDGHRESENEVLQKPDHQEKSSRKRSKKDLALQNKINRIAQEKSFQELQNQKLLEKIKYQEQLLSEKQNQLNKAEEFKDAYYESNLQTQESSVLNALKNAKEEGDIDREIELSKELARITAEQSTYNLYKTQIKKNNNEYYDDYDDNKTDIFPAQNFQEPFFEEEASNEAYDAWIDQNPWADPSSRNFSPRLRQEADAVANELETMLRFNQCADLIGTPDYFESISKIMNEKYGTPSKNSREKNLSGHSVSPVTRRGGSMSEQYIARNPQGTRQSIALTPEEYNVARRLQIKLPNGTMATPEEAVRRYAEAKRSSSF